jgi:AraC-like DNA-binding protein
VVGLSPDWFRRVFQRSYGCSPRAWILRERIRLAAQRLIDEPAESIGAVAAGFGYKDQYLFSRQFRQVMGKSPRDWRREV